MRDREVRARARVDLRDDLFWKSKQVTLQERIVKLEKLIEKAEASARKEQQPKKRFELYTKVHKYKQDLEELMRNP